MRFILGHIEHETNTFSNLSTTEQSFRAQEWAMGEQILKNHRNVRSYTGGMLDEAARLGIEVVPVFSASACPSGIIAQTTYETIKREMLQGIDRAGSIDAVCLSLHGAGVAEQTEDIEGDLIAAIRRLIGSSVPIVVTLDLHANVTPLMVDHATIIIGNNLYPHVDSFERGQEAVGLAKDFVEGRIRPVMHLTKLPLLIPTIGTKFEPVSTINGWCREQESVPGVLDCTFYHGFPYADIPAAGVSVLTIADNDANLAKRISERLANQVMELRDQLVRKLPGPTEGIALALQSEALPVVINETSDNPGGGAPGDGTHLLRAMLDSGLENACFAFIYDPETADKAHRAGTGAELDIELGGKSDTLHGDPLPLRVYVKSLTDGRFVTSSPMGRGMKVDLGRSARLQAGGVDIIVCSERNQVFDEQIFLLHGIDVRQKKIVALKSSHHFRAAFESLSEHIITVDSPGLSTLNFSIFPFRNVRRPIFPLDEIQ